MIPEKLLTYDIPNPEAENLVRAFQDAQEYILTGDDDALLRLSEANKEDLDVALSPKAFQSILSEISTLHCLDIELGEIFDIADRFVSARILCDATPIVHQAEELELDSSSTHVANRIDEFISGEGPLPITLISCLGAAVADRINLIYSSATMLNIAEHITQSEPVEGYSDETKSKKIMPLMRLSAVMRSIGVAHEAKLASGDGTTKSANVPSGDHEPDLFTLFSSGLDVSDDVFDREIARDIYE